MKHFLIKNHIIVVWKIIIRNGNSYDKIMVKEVNFDSPFFFLFISYFQKLDIFQHEVVSSLQQASRATYFNQVPFCVCGWKPTVKNWWATIFFLFIISMRIVERFKRKLQVQFATTMKNGHHTKILKEWTCMQKALPC